MSNSAAFCFLAVFLLYSAFIVICNIYEYFIVRVEIGQRGWLQGGWSEFNVWQ
jgi:hypothetical protein